MQHLNLPGFFQQEAIAWFFLRLPGVHGNDARSIHVNVNGNHYAQQGEGKVWQSNLNKRAPRFSSDLFLLAISLTMFPFFTPLSICDRLVEMWNLAWWGPVVLLVLLLRRVVLSLPTPSRVCPFWIILLSCPPYLPYYLVITCLSLSFLPPGPGALFPIAQFSVVQTNLWGVSSLEDQQHVLGFPINKIPTISMLALFLGIWAYHNLQSKFILCWNVGITFAPPSTTSFSTTTTKSYVRCFRYRRRS